MPWTPDSWSGYGHLWWQQPDFGPEWLVTCVKFKNIVRLSWWVSALDVSNGFTTLSDPNYTRFFSIIHNVGSQVLHESNLLKKEMSKRENYFFFFLSNLHNNADILVNHPYQQKWATTKSKCRGGWLQISTCLLVPPLVQLYLADLHHLGVGAARFMLQIYLRLVCRSYL